MVRAATSAKGVNFIRVGSGKLNEERVQMIKTKIYTVSGKSDTQPFFSFNLCGNYFLPIHRVAPSGVKGMAKTFSIKILAMVV